MGLWAIPVSEAESRFIAEQGDMRFEELLEASVLFAETYAFTGRG
jgi:hypothetical protein